MDSSASAAPISARIFTACHGTQLLVIQHLRRHLERPPAREFLIWYSMDNNPAIEELMRGVLTAPAFDDTLDMRDFQSLKPRIHGPLAWWFESTRRLRSDGQHVHAWLDANGIDEQNAELWADEPLHFNVGFSRGLLTRASHIKIPHSFNHEDCTSASVKASLERSLKSAAWVKRWFFLPWQRRTSGVDMRMQLMAYDKAYTFASPSCWSSNSQDVSDLITPEAFAATYNGLPQTLRSEVETELAPIKAGPRPLIILLLFGFYDNRDWRPLYQQALARIVAEHTAELLGGTLAVKWHPGAGEGHEERFLVDWLRANVPAQVHDIRHRLNLELMLPQLQPDYVMAGACGSLPVVRDMRAGRPIMLAELMPPDLAEWPGGQRGLHAFLRGIEVW